LGGDITTFSPRRGPPQKKGVFFGPNLPGVKKRVLSPPWGPPKFRGLSRLRELSPIGVLKKNGRPHQFGNLMSIYF